MQQFCKFPKIIMSHSTGSLEGGYPTSAVVIDWCWAVSYLKDRSDICPAKQASKQASKQAGKQASKQVSKQASKQTSKQAGKQFHIWKTDQTVDDAEQLHIWKTDQIYDLLSKQASRQASK